jgi:hypothetical protein
MCRSGYDHIKCSELTHLSVSELRLDLIFLFNAMCIQVGETFSTVFRRILRRMYSDIISLYETDAAVPMMGMHTTVSC